MRHRNIAYSLLGARLLLRKSKEITVFLFHEITDRPSEFQVRSGIHLSFRDYRKILSGIKQIYNVMSLSDFLNNRMSEQTEFSGSDVPRCLITFDDAWKGQKEAIKIATEDFRLPITLFTNAGTILGGVDASALLMAFAKQNHELLTFDYLEHLTAQTKKDNRYSRWQGPVMEWSDLVELSVGENVSIANHGFYHVKAKCLSNEFFNKNVRNNEKVLKTLRGFNRVFAYPHGRPNIDFSPEHDELLTAQGYDVTFSTQIDYVLSDQVTSLPRVTITQEFAKNNLTNKRFRTFVEGQILISRYRNRS